MKQWNYLNIQLFLENVSWFNFLHFIFFQNRDREIEHLKERFLQQDSWTKQLNERLQEDSQQKVSIHTVPSSPPVISWCPRP